MKFSVNQFDLYRALKDVRLSLPIKSERTVLESIELQVNEDGLTLVTSDGKITISSTAKAQVEDGGRTLVPGKLFVDMVNKLSSDTVLFDVSEGTKMKVKCGSLKANIGCSDMDYPEAADLSNVAPIHLDKEVLSDMIDKVSFAVSQQESRIMLTGVYMEVTPTELRMVALDGFRMAMQLRRGEYILPEGKELVKAVIPGKTVDTLREIMNGSEEKFITLRLSNENMSARIGETELVSALLAGEYTKYQSFIPASYATTLKIQRDLLRSAVDRAAIFANDGKSNLIKLSISNDKLIVASNSQYGAAVEELPILEMSGAELTIAFNTRFLSDILRHIDDNEIHLNMNTNVSPCILKPEEGDDYLYLLLPVRTYS